MLTHCAPLAMAASRGPVSPLRASTVSRVGARAHHVAGGDRSGMVAVAERVVELDERGLGRARRRVGEQHAAAQRRVAGEIRRRARAAVVEREEHLAAQRAEARPAEGQDRLLEGRLTAAHVVGRDQLRARKHRADLGVERSRARRRRAGSA